MTTRWLTAYFNHGDLDTRDLNVLEFVVPTTDRIPSLWNMDDVVQEKGIEEEPVFSVDAPIFRLSEELNAMYKEALFGSVMRSAFPGLKTSLLVGTKAISMSIASWWSIEQDDVANGGGLVQYRVLDGLNHFVRLTTILYAHLGLLFTLHVLDAMGRP